MMFKTVDQLKDFITWARTQGLKRAKVGSIEIELSELAFEAPSEPEPTKSFENTDTMTDTEEMSKEEYDKILFHSTNT